jgi:hypothetical protein
MPPEVDQDRSSLFMRRAAVLAEIEAEQNFIARPLEIIKLIYFILRTPGTAWPTDQNGHVDKDTKSIRSGMCTSELLDWLAASLGLLCIDCGSHCYPNCKSAAKHHSRRNRRQRYEQPASALADPQNQSRFTVTQADRLFVLDTYRPIFEKVRRKRKPRTRPSVIPLAPSLEPAA